MSLTWRKVEGKGRKGNEWITNNFKQKLVILILITIFASGQQSLPFFRRGDIYNSSDAEASTKMRREGLSDSHISTDKEMWQTY